MLAGRRKHFGELNRDYDFIVVEGLYPPLVKVVCILGGKNRIFSAPGFPRTMVAALPPPVSLSGQKNVAFLLQARLLSFSSALFWAILESHSEATTSTECSCPLVKRDSMMRVHHTSALI